MSSSPYKVSSEVAHGEGDWAAVPVFVREAIVEALMHSYSPDNVINTTTTTTTTTNSSSTNHHDVKVVNATPVRGESVSSQVSCPLPVPFLTEEQIQESVQTFTDAAHIRTAAVRSFGEFHNTIENLHVKLNPSLHSLWKTSMQLEESIMKRVQQSCKDTNVDNNIHESSNAIPDNVILTNNEVINIRKQQVVLERLVQQMEELRNASIVFAAYYLSDAEKWAMGTNPQYLRPEEVERALELKATQKNLHQSRSTHGHSRHSHRDYEASYDRHHNRAKNKLISNTSSNVNNSNVATTHHKVEENVQMPKLDNDHVKEGNKLSYNNNYTTPNLGRAVVDSNATSAATKNLPSRSLHVPSSSASSSSSSSFHSEGKLENVQVNKNNTQYYNNNNNCDVNDNNNSTKNGSNNKQIYNATTLSSRRTKPTDEFTSTSSHHNHPHQHYTHSHRKEKYHTVSKATDPSLTEEQMEPHEKIEHSMPSEHKPMRRRRVVLRRVRRHGSSHHHHQYDNDDNTKDNSTANTLTVNLKQ